MKNRVLNKDRNSCFVCQTRFKISIPPGPANMEAHHVFPRNAGGTDGPLVFLCSEHHGCLHKIAQRMQTKKAYKDLLAGENPEWYKPLLWLSSMVVKAEQFAEDDPNKMLTGGVKLSPTETALLSKLQKLTGKSRNELLRAGLHLLFKMYLPQKP